MQYSEVRSRIKSGDVISFSHKPWSSWYDIKIQIVRMSTRSEYCHSALAWVPEGGDRVFLIEAVSSGVRIFPLSRAGDFYWSPREGWAEQRLATALEHVGDQYSQWEAFKAFFSRSSYRNDVWECTEFVCFVLGIPLEKQVPSALVDYLMSTEGIPLYHVTNPQ